MPLHELLALLQLGCVLFPDPSQDHLTPGVLREREQKQRRQAKRSDAPSAFCDFVVFNFYVVGHLQRLPLWERKAQDIIS